MAVGPRVSKEEFMNALGLSAQDELFYRAMRVPLSPVSPPTLPTSVLRPNVRKRTKQSTSIT